MESLYENVILHVTVTCNHFYYVRKGACLVEICLELFVISPNTFYVNYFQTKLYNKPVKSSNRLIYIS